MDVATGPAEGDAANCAAESGDGFAGAEVGASFAGDDWSDDFMSGVSEHPALKSSTKIKLIGNFIFLNYIAESSNKTGCAQIKVRLHGW